MASNSSTCPYSALLDNLQSMMKFCPDDKARDLRNLIDGLRFLRIFLLYAKKWGNNYVNMASDHNVDIHHASLGALVLRIEDAISKWGPKINSIDLAAVKDPYIDGPFYPAFALGNDIRSLNREIYEWYAIFSDFSSKQSSNSPVKKDELMEFLDSVLEILVAFSDFLRENFLIIFRRRESGGQDEVKLFEGLEEKLKFLKNFMCFVTLWGIEEKLLGPLMSHIQAVTVNAACLSFKHRFIYQYELCEKIQKGVSVLLQKIIPVEPQVHTVRHKEQDL